jgi:hypothetical protein
MAVESLTICEWSTNSRGDEVISHPDWADVEASIRRLDNKTRNDIYLKPLNSTQDTFLGVGGGAGRYIVTGSENGCRFPTLSNPAGTDELVSRFDRMRRTLGAFLAAKSFCGSVRLTTAQRPEQRPPN